MKRKGIITKVKNLKPLKWGEHYYLVISKFLDNIKCICGTRSAVLVAHKGNSHRVHCADCGRQKTDG